MCPGPEGLGHTGVVTTLSAVLLALGALLTIGGAALLVLAFRRGQAGRPGQERTTFRAAVATLALGSLLFLATMVVSTPR